MVEPFFRETRAVQPRTVFDDAPCLKFSVDGYSERSGHAVDMSPPPWGRVRWGQQTTARQVWDFVGLSCKLWFGRKSILFWMPSLRDFLRHLPDPPPLRALRALQGREKFGVAIQNREEALFDVVNEARQAVDSPPPSG